jgi:hypothetical protein
MLATTWSASMVRVSISFSPMGRGVVSATEIEPRM